MVEAQARRADRDIPVAGGLSPRAVAGLAEYVKAHYLDPNLRFIAGGGYTESRSADGRSADLEWRFAHPPASGRVEPLDGKAVHLSLAFEAVAVRFPGLDPGDAAGERACARVADEVEVLVDSFLIKAKTTGIYFVFSAGEEGAEKDVPRPKPVGGDALRRLVSGNMMNLYLVVMALSFVLFLFLGDAAIFLVLAIQLLLLFYSDRVALLVGKVRPTSSRPRVTLVSVRVFTEAKAAAMSLPKKAMSDLGDRLEAKLAAGSPAGPEASSAAQEVLAAAGIQSSQGDVKVVTRDVYGLVESVARRFGLPVPKVTIVNSLADNASATGFSPGRASITITAGSLVDLDDDELSGVVGHEFGHVKGRDSIILFASTFLLYVGGLYLWLPLVLYLGLVYYLVVFAVIFSIGKVLETRADTESAVTLGQPGVLATALSSIGFTQLYLEKYSRGARLLDWLSFDPHPPIYFRIQRLSRLARKGGGAGNTFLVALRDCVSGFLAALA
ncbi:MAG TPA: M48 family metalloprotease [Nitrososphaerales archaeon]|nr:M48 family metalloprotease [Nitrososphaerales archaeon]